MAAHGYARTYQTQSVLTASPGQLVLLLYDGALRFLGLARAALEGSPHDPRRIETVNSNLLKAQNIIAELQGVIDHQAGGEIAANLDRLYEYYNRRLIEANLKKDVAAVVEVEQLLRELRDAWAEMLRRDLRTAPTPAGVQSVA
ncbi:MAG: flagellar export chaperone FliS [Opitutaceae bacterium]|nr:flagellar export chaperone FliS [Opitutaceae bacterium]